MNIAGGGTAMAVQRGLIMTTEERLDKMEREIEVLRQEVRDLMQRFLKYVQDVEEDPVKD